MTWEDKWAFLLILPLIIVVVWTYIDRHKKTPSFQFSGLQGLKRAHRTLRSQLIGLPLLLRFIALILAIMALARQ